MTGHSVCGSRMIFRVRSTRFIAFSSFSIFGIKTFTVRAVYDGKEGWAVVNGKKQILKKRDLAEWKAIAHSLYVETLTPLLDAKVYKLTVKGTAKVNRKPAVEIKVRRTGHEEMYLYKTIEITSKPKIEARFFFKNPLKDQKTQKTSDPNRITS